MSSLIFNQTKSKLRSTQYFTGKLKLALVDTPQNDILENSHSILVANATGSAHIFEMLHPAAEVAVLHKVLRNLNSITVWDLLCSVTHCLGEQEVSPNKNC